MQLNYPDNLGDTVQIAWESWSDLPKFASKPPHTEADLVEAVWAMGLLLPSPIGPEASPAPARDGGESSLLPCSLS